MSTERLAGVRSSSRRTVSLKRPMGDLLVLSPNLASRLFGLVFVALGLAGLYGAWMDLFAPSDRLAAWLVPMVFMIVGIALGGSGFRVEFDRASRTVRLRRWWWSTPKEWPVTAITGIQLIDDGWHRRGKGGRYFTYQLNLGVTDRFEPRHLLANHPDVQWSLATGREVAAFMGIPFHDGRSPAPPD